MKDKSTEIQNIKKNPHSYNGDVLSISSGLSPQKENGFQTHAFDNGNFILKTPL
tara:strand:- start:90 stop:251 length:162 start_codon:yes stop_codon:yes gene_type:complete